MGAKFIVDRRCTVKKQMTLIGLVEAIKRRGLLGEIKGLVAAGAVPEPVSDSRLEHVMPHLRGIPVEMTVGNLVAESDSLMQHKITCRQCSASLSGRVGGCIGYVPYPISEGMEYLLWVTAVKGLKAELPSPYLAPASAFAQKAMQVAQTPYATGMRQRHDLLRRRHWVYRSGSLWNRQQLTSSQVLELFFQEGVLAREDLQFHIEYLSAVLFMAGQLDENLADEEQKLALREDVQSYAEVYELMRMAAENRKEGVHTWP